MKLAAAMIALLPIAGFAQVSVCTASWYDAPAGEHGLHLTCASWFYPLGTKLQVTEVHNGNSVVVTVTDRGPAHRLVHDGRKIDLSRAAFAVLDGLDLGLADVVVAPVTPPSALPTPQSKK